MYKSFQAYMVEKSEAQFKKGLHTLTVDDLPEGDVLIKVSYSSINYKDALGSTEKGKIVQKYPMVLGIDLAGEVVESKCEKYKVGDKVIATSYDIGVSHYGGFSEYARLKSEWLVPLPEGMTEREAMIYGTGGFTAALSVHFLLKNGVTKEKGDVLVTGATGGVGSHAIALLSHLGYKVTASSGKEQLTTYLETLGANQVVSREAIMADSKRPLQKGKWRGVVDTVGGNTLTAILPQVMPHGTVALSGLTAGISFESTVYPFILRGICLQGIDSAYCSMKLRNEIWTKLAYEWKTSHLEQMVQQEISLQELDEALQTILAGNARGRFLIKIS